VSINLKRISAAGYAVVSGGWLGVFKRGLMKILKIFTFRGLHSGTIMI